MPLFYPTRALYGQAVGSPFRNINIFSVDLTGENEYSSGKSKRFTCNAECNQGNGNLRRRVYPMTNQRTTMAVLAVCGITTMGSLSVFAADLASDNAADATYNDGWSSSDHGGTGWSGNWSLTTSPGATGSEAGHFVGSSTANGDSSSGGDIDTGGRAWGLYANSSHSASATRGFATSFLDVGQAFVFDFDNGSVANGSSVSATLQGAGGTPYFYFGFTGGSANYTVGQEGLFGFSTDTGVGYTDEGLHVEIALTGANTVSTSITPRGGSTTVIQSTLAGNAAWDRIMFENNSAGTGDAANLYVNSMEVIPEPATMTLLGLGAMSLLAARRRKE